MALGMVLVRRRRGSVSYLNGLWADRDCDNVCGLGRWFQVVSLSRNARRHTGLSLCPDEDFAGGDHVSYEASEAASIPATVVR